MFQAESNMARYGRALLENLPAETTDLLIYLCTSLAPLTIDSDEPPPSSSRQPSTGASYLSYLALNRAAAPSEIASVPSTASTAATVRPTERAPRRDASTAESSRASSPPSQPSRTGTPQPAKPPRVHMVKRPSPRLYFAHFIDHRDQFLHFLEAVALKRWGQRVSGPDGAQPPSPVEPDPAADPEAEKRDQIAVWNTLLELYLSAPSSASTDKALHLLQSEDLPFDPTHALILCTTRWYTPGLVLLWEKMGMYEDVLRFWMDKEKEDNTSGASVEVVRCLERYGATRPHLYPLVLRFLSSSPELLSRHTEDVGRILEHIDQEKIIPPLGVVQILSRNGVTSIGLVKSWLMSCIKEAREEVDMVSGPLNL